MEYLNEFRRMTKAGPSLVEKTAGTGNAMLDALSKAFSKKVKAEDLRYIRYRKMGKGVELEDVAGRLGDILTSVEPKDADPKALMAFLKKHGAKTFKAEGLDENVYSVTGAGPAAAAGSDVANFCDMISKGVASAVRGKYFSCRPDLRFGTGGAFIDYANIPATSQPGGLDFLNAKVQLRLSVRGFDGEGNVKGSKIKVEKLTNPRGLKFRAKTGTPEQVAKYIVATVKKAAALGEAVEGINESIEESSQVGKTIIHQMGGPGAIRAMLGGSVAYLDKGVGIRWPNKQRSKGNYVEVILTPADEYDMTFYNMKGSMKYWHPDAQKKAVKSYKGVMFDQLREIFYKQTGWTLSKPKVHGLPRANPEKVKKARAALRASWKKAGLI